VPKIDRGTLKRVTEDIAYIAYEDRDPDWIFVEVPNRKGRYLRTDKSILVRDCPVCKAYKGEPCFSKSSMENFYIGQSHAARRRLSKTQLALVKANDLNTFNVDTTKVEQLGWITTETYIKLKNNFSTPGSVLTENGKPVIELPIKTNPDYDQVYKVAIYAVRNNV